MCVRVRACACVGVRVRAWARVSERARQCECLGAHERSCACVCVRRRAGRIKFCFDRGYARAILFFLYEISLYYLYYWYARMSILFKFT